MTEIQFTLAQAKGRMYVLNVGLHDVIRDELKTKLQVRRRHSRFEEYLKTGT